MRLVWSIVLVAMLASVVSCGSPGPTPEDLEQVRAMKKELEQVRSDISTAEATSKDYAGGLLGLLASSRVEVLGVTEALLQQRIHASESGTAIEIKVPGTKPDPALAAQLEDEIAAERMELAREREELGTAGGLLGAVQQTAVATRQQTIALLEQRQLAAKYGLAVPAYSGDVASGSNRPRDTQGTGSKAAIRREILSVEVLNKHYSQDDDTVWLDLQFKATGLDKPARAIKGVLVLQDLFGEPKFRIGWTIDQPIAPGQTLGKETVGFSYNQFMDDHHWVRATELRNMNVVFEVTDVLYEDGTRADL